jgi:hypothetical protein
MSLSRGRIEVIVVWGVNSWTPIFFIPPSPPTSAKSRGGTAVEPAGSLRVNQCYPPTCRLGQHTLC